MQDFRSEVKEFFAGDEQLAEELEFALKNAEKNREMEEENCPPAGEARTPTVEVSAAVVLSIVECQHFLDRHSNKIKLKKIIILTLFYYYFMLILFWNSVVGWNGLQLIIAALKK